MKWEPSKEHFRFITSVPFTHDDKTNADYYLNVEEKTLFCIFQSTHDERDWKSDFDFFPKRFDIYPGSKIKVHGGIAKQYLGMRNQFLDLAYREDVERIYIAGYSLGGGLAQLACEDAAWHFSPYNPQWNGAPKEIKSISYEGPRVFCRNGGVQALLANKQILVKTWWDPVVHLPFWVMGFRDYGAKVWIGRWWKLTPLQHLAGQIEANLQERSDK